VVSKTVVVSVTQNAVVTAGRPPVVAVVADAVVVAVDGAPDVPSAVATVRPPQPATAATPTTTQSRHAEDRQGWPARSVMVELA
jgi:hypothetical protein